MESTEGTEGTDLQTEERRQRRRTETWWWARLSASRGHTDGHAAPQARVVGQASRVAETGDAIGLGGPRAMTRRLSAGDIPRRRLRCPPFLRL